MHLKYLVRVEKTRTRVSQRCRIVFVVDMEEYQKMSLVADEEKMAVWKVKTVEELAEAGLATMESQIVDMSR